MFLGDLIDDSEFFSSDQNLVDYPPPTPSFDNVVDTSVGTTNDTAWSGAFSTGLQDASMLLTSYFRGQQAQSTPVMQPRPYYSTAPNQMPINSIGVSQNMLLPLGIAAAIFILAR